MYQVRKEKLQRTEIAPRQQQLATLNSKFQLLETTCITLKADLELTLAKLEGACQQTEQFSHDVNTLDLLYICNANLIALKTVNEQSSALSLLIKEQDLRFPSGNLGEQYQAILELKERLSKHTIQIDQWLEESQFKQINQKVKQAFFSAIESEQIYHELTKELDSIEQLIIKKDDVMAQCEERYQEVLHAYQEEVKQVGLEEDAKEALKRQELDKRKVNIEKYLGDGHLRGELNDYLSQRASTYFIRDFISNCFAFVLGWPFGYVTEKQKREDYINLELRPALEQYQQDGDNSDLKRVLHPKHVFFKPRSTNNTSYCFSLAYLIESLRTELLISEDLEVYQPQAPQVVNHQDHSGVSF